MNPVAFVAGLAILAGLGVLLGANCVLAKSTNTLRWSARLASVSLLLLPFLLLDGPVDAIREALVVAVALGVVGGVFYGRKINREIRFYDEMKNHDDEQHLQKR